MRLEVRQWLLVSEIFTTLQGEGPSAGQRALFIRLGGCNQHCKWCDTPYTWVFDKRHVDMHALSLAPFSPQEELTRMALVVLTERILSEDVELVVITGGEPMLQVDPLDLLISAVNESPAKRRFEIETAGTIAPGPLTDYENVAFNVSPKLAHSGNELDLRRNIPVLIDLVSLNSTFKFVTDGVRSSDIIEIESLIAEAHIPSSRVWLMPLGTTADAIIDGMKALAPIAMERGWNVTSRQQILIWGDTRGT